MTDSSPIPADINDRLLHFQEEVKKCFLFLTDFNYSLEKIETGRTDNFLNYYCNFFYQNGDTSVSVDYSTDIINGQTIAFPQVEQKPVIDDLVSCSISDSNAFMSIDQFARETQPKLSEDYFTIGQNRKGIKEEITRVVENYAHFFRNHLYDVLQRKKIYDCYIDRFYDKVFEEKHYR
jgi:hypothetical protein